MNKFAYGSLLLFVFSCVPQKMQPFLLPEETNDASNLIAADFNQDGTTDLAASLGSTFLLIPQTNGELTFESISVRLHQNLLAVDVDGDADIDILSFERGLNSSLIDGVITPIPRDFRLAINQGDGTFTAGVLTFPEELATDPTSLLSVEAADLDGDSDADMVLNWDLSEAFVLLQQDDRSLLARQLDVSGEVKIGDLNQDGRADLLASEGSLLQRLFNQGDGNFAEPLITDTELRNVQESLLVDLDGDLDLDVVAGTNDTGPLQRGILLVFENDGQGELSNKHEQRFIGVGNLIKIIARDLNGDQLPELALAVTKFGDEEEFLGAAGAANATLFKNKGNLRFRTKAEFSVEVEPANDGIVDFLFEDLTGDGAPDLFIKTQASGSLIADDL